MKVPPANDAMDSTRPLPEVMAAVAASAATGALRVEGPSGRRELLFVEGELRAARSEIESERLGAWLTERGVASRQEVAMGLLEQAGSDAPPLGHVLVEHGVTDVETLERELEQLACTIIERATVEPRHEVSFITNGGDGQLDTLPHLTTQQLLLDAARRQPDDKAVHRTVMAVQEPLRPAGRLNDIMGDVELEPGEAFVLSVLERSGTLEQLRAVVTLPPAALERVLYGLLIAGLLRVGTSETAAGDETVRMARGLQEDEVEEAPPAVAPQAMDVRGGRQAIERLDRRLADLDHYQVLGIPRGASYQQIYDAWQLCEALYDPARADSDPEMADMRPMLQRVYARAEDAFDTLFDPAQRTVYDRILGTAPGGGPSSTVRGEQPAASGSSRQEMVADLLQRAEAELGRRNLFEAHQCLERACRLDPTPETLLRLARVKLLNPRWTRQALDLLRRALETEPRFIDAWRELATFWRRRGKRERERKAMERVLALAPTDPEAAERYRELVGAEQAAAFMRRLHAGS